MKLIAFISILLFVSNSYGQRSCLLKESEIGGKPVLIMDITERDQIPQLDSICKKNGYKYPGFKWKNAIWEVVNQKDFALLKDIVEFKEDDKIFTTIFESTDARKKFYQLICPILNDPKEFDQILGNAKKY